MEACPQLACAAAISESLFGMKPSRIPQTMHDPKGTTPHPMWLQRHHGGPTWFYRNSEGLPLAQQTLTWHTLVSVVLAGGGSVTVNIPPLNHNWLLTKVSELFCTWFLSINVTIYWSLHLVIHLRTTLVHIKDNYKKKRKKKKVKSMKAAKC